MGIVARTFHGIDQGEEAAKYFSAINLLGRAVRLLRANRQQPRLLDDEFIRDEATDITAGADGFPFLLASHSSLDALHDEQGLPRGLVPLNRFRANIEIDGYGIGPFGEDFIDPDLEFTIGTLGVWAVKPCARCPIPNIDQTTGELAEIKASALLKTRVGHRVGGASSKMFFAQNLVHRWTEGQKVAKGNLIRINQLAENSSVILKKPIINRQ